MEQQGVVVAGEVKSVLVIDDDERVAAAMARALRLDREVFIASDASSGVALAMQERPDLAIVDLRLGSESGIDVIRELRRASPETTITLLSGYLSIDITVEAVKAGADVVLAKPVTVGEVLHRVLGDDSNHPVTTPSLAQVEAEHIARVLTDCNHNISEAARRLGIYRSSLQRKLRKQATKPRS